MNKLNFKKIEYENVKVNSLLPEIFKKELSSNFLKPGKCLSNSYQIAIQNDEIKMVEGFLITTYEDKTIEAVGHVWNKYNDIYFDLSKDLIVSDKKIENSKYFKASEYYAVDISTEEKRKISSDIYNLETETHIVFKTNVQSIEKELRDFLNQHN